MNINGLKFLFKKPKNELEDDGLKKQSEPSVPPKLLTACPSCKKNILDSELSENLKVCKKCSYHFRVPARYRIDITVDEGSFTELYGDLTSSDPLKFPQYGDKLKASMKQSGENEAVICGKCKIGGIPCAVFAMDPAFMMGSMGSVVGEKITRLFEDAEKEGLPVVGFTLSGGARMQEGILSLMQMAKTSAAVYRHGEAGNLYVTVLCDPTTGGVTASFAMLGDIILSEPGALIGFAGPRVIEQTIRQKLPPNFQKAEFLLDKGFIDAIVSRSEMKQTLSFILSLHKKKGAVK